MTYNSEQVKPPNLHVNERSQLKFPDVSGLACGKVSCKEATC